MTRTYLETIEKQAEQIKEICPDIAKHIARACEQAYRRGYQQGATYGSGKLSEVAKWRFLDMPKDFDPWKHSGKHRYDQATPPPGVVHKMPARHRSSLYRLQCEAQEVSQLMIELAH